MFKFFALLSRYPLTLLFLISAAPLLFYIRPGPDIPMPQVFRWMVVPAYILTFAVSIFGLRRPANLIVAFLVCVAVDYLLWTVLLRRRAA